MNPSSPGLEPDPGSGSDIQMHGSSPHPEERQEASDLAQQQQDQERKNASVDTPQPVGATQSELPQEESERRKLMKKLHIEQPISWEQVTTAPTTFKVREERKTYTSFGDNGTTASVSAYGHLLQISQYFGIGHSGFFCADLPEFSSPYYSKDRLRDILRKAQSNAATIGIDWKKAFADSWDFDDILPRLEFVNDRWPRFVSSVPDQYVDYTAQSSQDQKKAGDKTASLESHPSSALSMNFSFSVQYFCDDGTIFQKCTLERKAEVQADLHLGQLKLQANLLIRNLDFTEHSDFNEEDINSNEFRPLKSSEGSKSGEVFEEPEVPIYSYRLGVNDGSLKVIHQITQESSKEMGLEEAEHQKAVVLSIIPYVNGELQSLNLEGKAATIDLSEHIKYQAEELGVLDVVLAYKLQFGCEPDNKPAGFENIMNKSPMSGHEDYERIAFANHLELDFIIRRNLNHILSVCSIPVSQSTTTSSDGRVATSTYDDNSPIALTCGDISGHYVGLAASFYAMQFLREMSQYLETQSPSPYVRNLQERIRATCKRHLRWVFESTAEAFEETDQPAKLLAFAPHYWVSGQNIRETQSLPGPSRADTPLQILKVFDNSLSSGMFHINSIRAHKDSSALSDKSMQTLSKRFVAWLQDLDENDERKRYAFARPSPTDRRKFHLVDHILISQALTKLNLIHCYEKSMGGGRFSEADGVTSALKRFEPKLVERQVLRRFITENPVSKQRTIATSRTASDTRFLFHSKDTALFHAMDSWIFSKEQPSRDEQHDAWKYIMDEWRNTIECQAEHEETRELKWRKPLWYALSFILASKERSINSTSPDVILKTTGSILFGMASPSGLFPGYLTSGQAPMEFDEENYRENYWQTIFEIPYIIWKYGKDNAAEFASAESSRFPSANGMREEISTSKKKSGFMAKRMQFTNVNRLNDPRGLVEISDDWLQQGPEALIFGSDPGFLQFQNSDASDPVITPINDFPSSSEEVASAGWHTYHSEVQGKAADSFTDEKGKKGLIVDVSRRHKLEKKNSPLLQIRRFQESKDNGLDETLHDNKTLAIHLGQPRDVQLAKKRLIWLPQADKETAMVCCLASPLGERYDLSAFFDRHALYDKYFSDHTSAALNEWKTEFQLSFYRLAGFSKLDDFHGGNGIPKFSYVVPQPEDSQRRAMHPKEEAAMVVGVVRAAMGFRFVGDFFDRYWTCHFLEYVPGNQPPKAKPNESTTLEVVDVPCADEEDTSNGNQSADFGDTKTLYDRLSGLKYIQDHSVNPRTGKKTYPWQQRKVLELLLFDHILLHIEKETKDIFNWARASVLKASGYTEGGESRYSTMEAQGSVLGLKGSGDNGQPYKMAASDPLNPLSVAIDSIHPLISLGDSESYLNFISTWRVFEEIFRTLEEDLTENIEKISSWGNREKDREPERPRWTRNDERLFRRPIETIQIRSKKRIKDLEKLKADIQKYRGLLSTRLESIREDISMRGSENMSLFTYVTVVFLPLGFSTGVFSMSQAPEKLTLIFMVATAITSLSITVFALANSRILGKGIVEPLIEFIQSFGRPLISIIIIPCLFLVYSVDAVLRPIYHPIYKHTAKPTLDILGRQEYLKRYKVKLRPIRELDWTTLVQEWFEKETNKRKEKKKRKEAEKKANDPEGQQGSRETVQRPTI